MYLCGIHCNFSFISDFIYLSSFSLFFFLVSLAKGFPTSFVFSKNQLLVSLIFFLFYFSLYFIYFCSDLYYFLHLLILGFIFSSFSSSFRCNVRLFIGVFYFLRQTFSAMNFPPGTTFTISHRLWYVIFLSFLEKFYLFMLLCTGFLQLQRRDFSLQQRLLLPAQALGNMGSVVVARGHWSTGSVVAVYRLVCVYSGSSYSEFSGLPGSGCLFPSPGKFSATFPSNNFSCPFSSSGSL